MNELPKGWAIAPIGNVCTLNNGRAFKPTEWSSSGLPIVRIQNLNNASATFNYFDGDFESKYHLKGGELLFAWSGTPGTSFGAHVWRDQEAVLNQHIFRVDFDEKSLDKRFFRHAINQTLDHLIDIAHGGVGLRHVTKGKFENTSIALPPLPEQKRIADKLDCTLARVEACRDRIDRLPALLKRFRQSILAAATSGRLTEDWRTTRSPDEAQRNPGTAAPNSGTDAPAPAPAPEPPEPPSSQLPSGWRHVTFADVCREITVGYVGKMSDQYRESGIPFLRSMNVRAFRFDPKGLLYISSEFHQQAAKSTLRPGDLAVVRSGAPGICCVIPAELEEANCSDLVIARPSPELVPEYGCIFMNSTFAEDFVRANKVGVAQAHFNVGSMKITPLPLPSIEEQHEIVHRVETLFAFADRLEARLATARKQAEQLTPALLAKAFRGELVPQDPNDEPASELLKRLATTRSEAPKAKRGRKAANA